jgi:hypothetical protein
MLHEVAFVSSRTWPSEVKRSMISSYHMVNVDLGNVGSDMGEQMGVRPERVAKG